MKIDLQSLLGGKAAAPRQKLAKKGGESAEFAAELEPRLASTPRGHVAGKPADERREKKDRPSPELLAHALLVPPALPRIDTKQTNLKAAPAEAAAVSTRAKASSHELTVPGEKSHAAAHKKARPVDELAKPELTTAHKAEAPVATSPTEAPTPKFELPTVAAPKEAAPLAAVAPMMLEDPSVRAVLLPTVARVSLETADSGRLHVQLKVNDGVTEIRASGPAAQLLESRQGELKVALAKEGLALGHFDLTQSNSQQQHHQPSGAEGLDAPSVARRAARSNSTSSEGAQSTSDGHLHVKA